MELKIQTEVSTSFFGSKTTNYDVCFAGVSLDELKILTLVFECLKKQRRQEAEDKEDKEVKK